MLTGGGAARCGANDPRGKLYHGGLGTKGLRDQGLKDQRARLFFFSILSPLSISICNRILNINLVCAAIDEFFK